MNLAELKLQMKGQGKKARKRVGRGPGSGHGKTSGRGTKGAGARAGFKRRARYEGGQMPLYRRLPKRGFNNREFETRYAAINVGALAKLFDSGAAVDLRAIQARGLLQHGEDGLKVLGNGEITHPLHLTAAAISAGARQKIEAAGGSVTLVNRVFLADTVDLAQLADHPADAVITPDSLVAEGLCRADRPLRITAKGKTPAKAWTIAAHSFQPRAKRMLRQAGAAFEEIH